MPKTAVRVLLIEDDGNGAETIRSRLAQDRPEFAVAWACQWSDAQQRLDQDDFDAILAVVTLADGRGLDTIRRILNKAPEVPLVMLTDVVDAGIAMAARRQGARNYLIKDHLTPELLERTIRGAIQRQRNSRMRRLLKRMRARQQALQRKNRRLTRLIRTAHRAVENVSHDFRTPLTVITEYASLLRDGIVGKPNEQNYHMLNVIGDRADDLNSLVDDLLDSSELRAGAFSVYRKRCTVSAIVARVRPNLNRKAAIRKLRFTVDVDDNLPEVFCDPDKAGRVIVTLVAHAVKYCGDSTEVKLWVRHDTENVQLIVGVTVDGADRAGPLEEEFQQLSPSDAHSDGNFKRCGLRLSIARQLVERNLGQLYIERNPRESASLFFTIPLASPNAIVTRYIDWVARRRRCGMLSVVAARIDESTPEQTADEVNAFLHYSLRQEDLLFRVSVCHWLLMISLRRESASVHIDRMKQLHHDTNQTRARRRLPEISIHALSSSQLDAARTEIVAQLQTLVDPVAMGQGLL